MHFDGRLIETHTISGVTGGGQVEECPPETSDREIFADLQGKKEGRKNGKGGNGEEKKENCEREGGKLKMGGGKCSEMRRGGEDLLPFFFFVVALHFQNEENLFWGYQNRNFLPGKSISRQEKNQEKWLCPLRKNFPVMPLHIIIA